MDQKKLNALGEFGEKSFLIGIEKEALRTNNNGSLSKEKHPECLGSTLTNKNITTDFSEAQVEIVSDTYNSVDELQSNLDHLHNIVYSCLNNEYLWPYSMPSKLPKDADIPIAQFGKSNIGIAKNVYRKGLVLRYGAKMQMISGIHFNFSFTPLFINKLFDCNQVKYISKEYLNLIRNYKSYSWLITYLFGFSPICNKDFLNERYHNLKEFSKESFHIPSGLSIRQGPLGYQSDLQNSIMIDHNTLNNYIKGMKKALTDNYPPYEKIGIFQNDQHIQLSTSLLQIENEYYSSIRPKQPIKTGERPLVALKERGIKYVEVRGIDINPFSPTGISKEQIYFLQVFLSWCFCKKSEKENSQSIINNNNNMNLVSQFGLDENLKINDGVELVAIDKISTKIFDDLIKIAQILDRKNEKDFYEASVLNHLKKVQNKNKHESFILKRKIEREFNGSAEKLFIDLAKKYKNYFLNDISINKKLLKNYQNIAKESLSEFKKTNKPDEDFINFLKKYNSQILKL
jgi:glutamate--cysteine ligase